MKYESTILKRLIDTYGVVGNPRYISEIIKEFIVRGKECFPNLFTYQSDWLAHIDEFGLNPTYTVSYTGQSIYAPNTLERPVKSAILKGSTTDSILNFEQSFTIHNTTKDFSFLFPPKLDKEYVLEIELTDVTSINGESDYIAVRGVKEDGSYIEIKRLTQRFANGTYEIPFTFNENYSKFRVGFALKATIVNMKLKGELISVKMPVLTTTGKNLFDIEKLEGLNVNIEMIPNGIRIKNSQFDITRCFTTPFKENTQYTVSFKHTQIEGTGREGFRFYYTDGTSSYIIPVSNSSCIGSSLPNKTIESISLSFNNEGTSELTYIQFEEGTTATSYEPYKSNILTASEDVELRGIGDVRDTLDLLTGEVTQRIGEIVFSSSDGFNYLNNQDDGNFSSFAFIENYNRKPGYNGEICDRLKRITNYMVNENGIYYYGNSGKLELRLDTTNFISRDLIGLNDYLSKNPITVQYALTTESVKTVDLTILDQNGQNVKQLMSFNGGTHFNTTSLEGSPLPTVSVSVETDLEETLMMCSLEGNTL